MGLSRHSGKMAVLALAWMGGLASAAPPATGRESPADVGPEERRRVTALRRSVESSLDRLEKLQAVARRGADRAKMACVEENRTRARYAAEVAAGELVVIRDPSTDGAARTFAIEKLDAAARRLGDILRDAEHCGLSPEEGDEDRAQTDLDAVSALPVLDPTQTPVEPPVPPPIDLGRLPVVASPSQ